jgi:NitT/TauT family transport system ATP-binding protein
VNSGSAMRVGTRDAAADRSSDMITIESVSKAFPVRDSDKPRQILDDVSLQVAAGEIYCLVGPSGSGKSTILRMLAGFDEPTSGRITVNGDLVGKPGPDRVVVFQTALLYPWLKVSDIVSLGPRLRGEPRSLYAAKAATLVDAVGLSGYEEYYPYELSGGMQQRVALARALINEPKVLLLDEPFGALDAQTRITMQQLLMDVWSEFRPTIFFITHDVEEALFLGDAVGVLSKQPGRILEEVRLGLPQPREFRVTTTAEFGAARQEILTHLV